MTSLEKKQIIEKIIDKAENIYYETGTENIESLFYWYENGINDAFLKTIKKDFDINYNENILCIYYRNYLVIEEGFFSDDYYRHKVYLLILNEGIMLGYSVNSNYRNIDYLIWEEIDYFAISNGEVNIFYKNSNDFKVLSRLYFGGNLTDESLEPFINMLNTIVKTITDYKTSRNESYITFVEEIIIELSNENYANSLELIVKFEKSDILNEFDEKPSEDWHILFLKSCNQYYLNNLNDALLNINKCIKLYGEINNNCWGDKFYNLRGLINKDLGNTYQSLQDLTFALSQNYIEENLADEIRDTLDNTYLDYTNNFLALPTDKRKVLLIDNQFNDLTSNNFKVLHRNQLPNLTFPFGHPINKNLYIVHPYKSELYIPISEYEDALFIDRINEFSYLVQCLGASKLSIENMKGKDLNTFSNNNEIISAGGSITSKLGVNINTSNTNNINKTEIAGLKIERTQVFSPSKKPFLPDNLIWYSNQPTWKYLYEQRLNGNLLQHSEVISTKQNTILSTDELIDIKADLKALFLKANYESTNHFVNQSNESQITEWKINIEFEPIKNLGKDVNHIENDLINLVQTSSITLLAKEQEYVDEIKECLVEGQISDGERRILHRLAKKLNISEERALELENIANGNNEPNYTPNELEYIEEIKFCLENDAEISPSGRRMLNKEQVRLEITPERAILIEESIFKT